MLVGQPQLGFSITDPFKAVGRGIKTVAKTGYQVAQDPRVQRAAVAAAQAYAPSQYAQATMYAQRAQQILRPPGAPPPPPPQMMPMPMPEMPEDVAPAMAPVQKGNMLPMLLLGGGALVLILLLRR